MVFEARKSMFPLPSTPLFHPPALRLPALPSVWAPPGPRAYGRERTPG